MNKVRVVAWEHETEYLKPFVSKFPTLVNRFFLNNLLSVLWLQLKKCIE
jgi:hypothetical protein